MYRSINIRASGFYKIPINTVHRKGKNRFGKKVDFFKKKQYLVPHMVQQSGDNL